MYQMSKLLKILSHILLLELLSVTLSLSTFANAMAAANTVQGNFKSDYSFEQLPKDEVYASNALYYSAEVSTYLETDENIENLSNDIYGSTGGVINSSNYRHDFLLDNFWRRYGERIYVILFFTLLGIVFWIYALRSRANDFKRIAASESMLRNISSNINGGVLLLNPQKEYQISFVNEGLLKLMGYTEDELRSIYERDYFYFIHPDDRHTLNKLLTMKSSSAAQGNEFSVQLNVRTKEGKFIPSLVKGSFVRNEKGEKELFCMIVDVSREQAILEELKFEQESHRILLEKSDEILFEIDYIEQTVKVSPQFKEKFGWALPKRYWGDEKPNLSKIYEEDRQKFSQALEDIRNGTIDGELIVRVCKSDGTPCWSKAIYHVMQVGGENKRLIGKLTDIDDEIKEKQLLMTKAQVDALTDIYNKDAFKDRCIEYLSKFPDKNNSLIFFDVDNFKDINDCLGHATGDRALRDISRKMMSIFSTRDILGRFGGDEFCVLLKDVTKEELTKLLDRLIEELRLEYSDGHHNVSVSVSVGAVNSSEFGNDFNKLLEYADRAQYYAKEKGKNGYCIYSDSLRLRGYKSRKKAIEEDK
ncbi:MAG: diguanylate cyclase [Clostridia bacterium]|nr:diguanylate cyclase [Clostridia bacterium]